MALDTKVGQLYFPFMLDLTPYSEYILDELPVMKEQHLKYKALMKDNLDLNDYLAQHYCNPDSIFYYAEEFHRLHNPEVMPDGYIVSTHDFNNRLYQRDRAS